jgi:oligoribonuclease
VLVWADIETTGLDRRNDVILEVAVIITDDALNEIASYEGVTCGARYRRLEDLAPVVQEMHTKSGLWRQSRCCSTTLHEMDWILSVFLQKHGAVGAPLAGASVHFDRALIAKDFPNTHARLHYRNLDVSTFHETAKRFWPEIHATAPPKRLAHESMKDIRESIDYLRYYLTALRAARIFTLADGEMREVREYTTLVLPIKENDNDRDR